MTCAQLAAAITALQAQITVQSALVAADSADYTAKKAVSDAAQHTLQTDQTALYNMNGQLSVYNAMFSSQGC